MLIYGVVMLFRLLISLGLLLGCAWGYADERQVLIVREDSQPISWLFMLSTKDAYIVEESNILRLAVPIDANVVMFSDRPERIVRPISLSGLFDAWSRGRDSFENTPPNAAIALGDKKAVVALTDFEIRDNKAYFTVVEDGGVKNNLMQGDVGNLFMVLDSVVIVRRFLI